MSSLPLETAAQICVAEPSCIDTVVVEMAEEADASGQVIHLDWIRSDKSKTSTWIVMQREVYAKNGDELANHELDFPRNSGADLGSWTIMMHIWESFLTRFEER